GLGLMYEDFGLRLPPGIGDMGVFDLIAGRTYCNLSRQARMAPGFVPAVYPFAALKAAPEKALDPQPARDPTRLRPTACLCLPFRLPGMILRAVAQAGQLGHHARTFADRFSSDIAPSFRNDAQQVATEDFTALDDAALLARLGHWVQRTVVDFARESLKPTALA